MSAWVQHWKAAAETGDAGAATEALARDVLLISPVTARFTFRGREEIGALLVSVFEVFREIRFTEEVRQEDLTVLFASGRVGDTTLHETQCLRIDGEGRIEEITLFMRPLPALTRFVRELGPRVAVRQNRRGAAAVLRLAGGFQHALVSSGERTFLPLTRPASARAGHRPQQPT